MSNVISSDLVKRSFDIVAAAVALVVLAPIMSVVALVIMARMGAPIFFSQERPGRDGRIFVMWKFRTMIGPCDAKGVRLSDAERLTPWGGC